MPQFVNNTPASLIIFLHILKTAGSTFNNLLDDYYTVQNSAATSPTRLHPNGSVENLTSLSREQRQKIELLYGHMGFGLHQHFSRPAHYITILREPVSRVISQYRHEKRVPLSNTYTLLQKGMDLKGFVDYYNDFQTDNMQTRMLAGNWQGRGYGACTPEMFAQAKYNLENHFVLVGLTKWFDAFYLMACDHFGWKTRFYNRLEVSRNATPPEQITAATRDYIASHNQYDIQLFQFVETRVAAEIEAQGPLFQKRLKRYQTFNRMYQQGVKVRRFSVRTYIRQNWLRGQSPTD